MYLCEDRQIAIRGTLAKNSSSLPSYLPSSKATESTINMF